MANGMLMYVVYNMLQILFFADMTYLVPDFRECNGNECWVWRLDSIRVYQFLGCRWVRKMSLLRKLSASERKRKQLLARWQLYCDMEAFCPKVMGVGLAYLGVARNKSAWSMKKSYLANCHHVVMHVFMNLQAKFKFNEIKSNPLSKCLARQARLEVMRQKQEELKKAPSLVNLSCNRHFQSQTNLWYLMVIFEQLKAEVQ